ncbi:MAG: hypothetical protein LBB59_04125 [Campylobacteraceae bacterium]|jgi:hypothetical protein|nr:hypothetical protein [Campylobacteraceae bacterium]
MLLDMMPLKNAVGLLNLTLFDDIFTIITFFPYLVSCISFDFNRKISKTNEINEIAVEKEAKKAKRYGQFGLIGLFVLAIYDGIIRGMSVVFALLFFVLIPMIIILPFSVILILQSYNFTKAAICAAALETAFFWLFFFSPIFGALFGC